MRTTSLESVFPLVDYDKCKSLRDAYVEAVRKLGALKEKQTRAVLESDPNFRVLDVMIREANAAREEAKHAHAEHRKMHLP